MRRGQALRRRSRHVDAYAARALDRVEGVRQVVTRTGADLHDGRGVLSGDVPVVQHIFNVGGHGLHEGGEVSAGQEGLASVDHRCVVARITQAGTSRESYIPLSRDVIAVAGFGNQGAPLVITGAQARTVYGVGKEVNDICKHEQIPS